MRYVLESISDEEKTLLFSDIKSSSDVQGKHFLKCKYKGDIPDKKSADSESESILFRLSNAVRPDDCHEYYMFRFEGSWYEFYLEGIFDYKVSFLTSIDLSESKFIDLKQNIVAAFEVYGMGGEGLSVHKGLRVAPYFDGDV